MAGRTKQDPLRMEAAGYLARAFKRYRGDMWKVRSYARGWCRTPDKDPRIRQLQKHIWDLYLELEARYGKSD